MPTHRKKKDKPSVTENAPVSKGWQESIQGRKPYTKEGQKGIFYKK